MLPTAPEIAERGYKQLEFDVRPMAMMCLKSILAGRFGKRESPEESNRRSWERMNDMSAARIWSLVSYGFSKKGTIAQS